MQHDDLFALLGLEDLGVPEDAPSGTFVHMNEDGSSRAPEVEGDGVRLFTGGFALLNISDVRVSTFLETRVGTGIVFPQVGWWYDWGISPVIDEVELRVARPLPAVWSRMHGVASRGVMAVLVENDAGLPVVGAVMDADAESAGEFARMVARSVEGDSEVTGLVPELIEATGVMWMRGWTIDRPE